MGLTVHQLHQLDQLADGRTVCNDDQNKLKAALTKIQADNNHDDVFYFGKVESSKVDKCHVVYGLVNGTLEKKWYVAGDDFVFGDMDAPVAPLDEEAAADEEAVAQHAADVAAKEAFAATIRQIDSECNIVPKGSWRVKETAYVPAKVANDVDHTNVSTWLHMRTPQNFAALNAASRVDAPFHRSVMDGVADTSCWATRINSAGTVVKLRNIKWRGACAVHDLASGEHGFVYVGSGRVNNNLQWNVPDSCY